MGSKAIPGDIRNNRAGELSFLFHRDVQRIFNNFTALFSIRIGFYSPDGQELRVGENRDLCRYCRQVRLCPGGREACLAEDRKARLRAMERGSLVSYTCHGGMTEAVMPIKRDDRLIGFAMIGQIRIEENPPAGWVKKWNDKRGKPPGEMSLEEAFREQPVCRRADLPRILELFSDLMDMIASGGKIEARESGRLPELMAWIKNHRERKITLEEAAGRIGLSPSRLSHCIKEEYGLSFTALVTRFRMEEARFLLGHFPEKTVKEVALSLGFRDPLYFSRKFKKETGLTPNQYKKQQINP